MPPYLRRVLFSYPPAVFLSVIMFTPFRPAAAGPIYREYTILKDMCQSGKRNRLSALIIYSEISFLSPGLLL